jgi:hypothetical protein
MAANEPETSLNLSLYAHSGINDQNCTLNYPDRSVGVPKEVKQPGGVYDVDPVTVPCAMTEGQADTVVAALRFFFVIKDAVPLIN